MNFDFNNHINFEIHWAAIIQNLIIILGVFITVRSIRVLASEAEGTIDSAQATAELVRLEIARDQQTRQISSYIQCFIRNPSVTNSEFEVHLVINNFSNQPINEVVATIFKRKAIPVHSNNDVNLNYDEFPIAVVGPKCEMSTNITQYFKSSNLDYVDQTGSAVQNDFTSRIIEAKYSVNMKFRTAEGLYVGQIPGDGRYESLNAQSNPEFSFMNALQRFNDERRIIISVAKPLS